VSCAAVAASLPGGDPLAAAIAAGETPSPPVVAAAAVQGALAPARALLLGAVFVVALAAVAAWQWNPAALFGFSRSADVLSAQTRDLLADLGYPDSPVDTEAGFRYRYPDWRNPSVVDTERPGSRLAGLRRTAGYFGYREQPAGMTGTEVGELGREGRARPLAPVAGPAAFAETGTHGGDMGGEGSAAWMGRTDAGVYAAKNGGRGRAAGAS